MESLTIRPFRRGDRDQLADLVNAHARAVVPGVSVSVNAIMAQLEHEPNEFILDPWIEQRATLVAELRSRIVGGAHLVRYSGDPSVGEHYRGAGEIRWLLFWPASHDGPHWPDPSPAGQALMSAACRQLDTWGASPQYAGGDLPAPGVYGVPGQWPHVSAAYEAAGFRHGGRIEVIFMARLRDLRPGPPRPPGLTFERTVGVNGTRFTGRLGSEAGYIEVELRDEPHRTPGHVVWADIGNLELPDDRGEGGLGRWLIEEASRWMLLSGADAILAYATPDDAEEISLLSSAGFTELTRTARGWSREQRATGTPRRSARPGA